RLRADRRRGGAGDVPGLPPRSARALAAAARPADRIVHRQPATVSRARRAAGGARGVAGGHSWNAGHRRSVRGRNPAPSARARATPRCTTRRRSSAACRRRDQFAERSECARHRDRRQRVSSKRRRAASRRMTDVGLLIVGAGPTGLGAAWRLTASGETNWLLCEAAADAGGLAGSVVDDHGFTWDLGGHVQFSHYDYFDDLM